MSAHLFDVETAKRYGVNAAIMVRHLHFWIDKNKANNRHFHEGRTWTYTSLKALAEVHPYWSTKQVRVILETLIKEQVILKGKFSLKGYDRTNWYAFVDEAAFAQKGKSICPFGQMDVSKLASPFARTGKTISVPNPDGLPVEETVPIAKSSQGILDLDLRIAEQARFLSRQLDETFRPSKNSATVLAKIVRHFVQLSQQDPARISLFKDAVEWAMIARAEGRKSGGIALFVAKVKEASGFGRRRMLLNDIKSRRVAGT